MAPNSLDYEVIRNTIARYCIALDNKDFDLLNDVFAENGLYAKYPFGGAFTDRVALADAIRNRYVPHARKEATTRHFKPLHCNDYDPRPDPEFFPHRLGPVVTQHALTTQTITINEDGKTASATTYFTGVHLGQGRWKGQLVTAYGKYIDELICILSKSPPIAAASGQWLVNKREVVFIGRVGEEGVMKGEQD